MKPAYLVLPFLAVLVAATGLAVQSSFPTIGMMKFIGWGVSLFLVLAWVALDIEGFKSVFARKGAKYGAGSGVVILLGLCVIIGLAVVSSRPRFNKSFDLTRDRLNTLSDQSKKMVSNLNEKSKVVTIEGFFLEDQVEQQFKDTLGLYQAVGAEFQIEYLDPQEHPTRAIAEKISSNNTVIFRLGDQESRITVFTEEKITNALINVMKEGTKKVYFTEGHGEGQLVGEEPTGFDIMSKVLEGAKISVAALSILDQAKIPEDADLVVIAGPKYDFKEEEVRFLDEYLNKGGSVLAMVDALSPIPNLNGMLEQYGIAFNNDLLLLHPDDPRAILESQNAAVVSEFDDFTPITRDFARQSKLEWIIRNVRSVKSLDDNPNKMKVTVAGKTSEFMLRVDNVINPEDLKGMSLDPESMGSYGVIAVATGKPLAQATANNGKSTQDGDVKSDVSAGGGTQSNKESRLVAIGSVQFANNVGSQRTENRDMFMNAVNYLLQDESFISISPKDPTKSQLVMSQGASFLVLLLLTIVYPLFFLGGGIVNNFKRRRL